MFQLVCIRRVLACLSFAATATVAVAADAYPARPLRFVLPYGPGVSTDVLARMVATKLTERLGWAVVVENKPGGRFVVAANEVLNAPNDGHAIYVIGNSMTVVAKVLPFNLMRDFTPVTSMSALNLTLVSSPKMGFKTVQDVAAYAKANPNTLNFAGNERGSNNHLSGELLKKAAGIDMQHIPYKDSSYIADVVSGRTQLAVMTLTSVVGLVKTGELQAIALLGDSRDPVYKNIPTVAEQGIRMPAVDAGNGFMVKAGTAPAIIERLNREINAVLALPDVRERFLNLGAIPTGGTAAAYETKLRGDIDLWQQVMKDAGVTIE